MPTFLVPHAGFLPTHHQVIYIDLLGNRHLALCDSGSFQGAVWRDDQLCEEASENVRGFGRWESNN